MKYLSGSLGPTASYTRREFVYLGLPAVDGRDGTIFLNSWHAQRRHNTQVFCSTYSIGEVEAVGFAGRVFVVDKLTGEDEHPRKPGDRLPPYSVRVQERTGEGGEVHTVVSCNCMASGCNVPVCRHRDLIAELLEQGAFDDTQNGYSEERATTRSSYDAGRLCGHLGESREVPTSGRGNPQVLPSSNQSLDNRQVAYPRSRSASHPSQVEAHQVIENSV